MGEVLRRSSLTHGGASMSGALKGSKSGLQKRMPSPRRPGGTHGGFAEEKYNARNVEGGRIKGSFLKEEAHPRLNVRPKSKYEDKVEKRWPQGGSQKPPQESTTI